MIRLNVVVAVVGVSVAMTISFHSLDQRPRCRDPACSPRVRAGRGECIFYAYCTQFRAFMASAVQSGSSLMLLFQYRNKPKYRIAEGHAWHTLRGKNGFTKSQSFSGNDASCSKLRCSGRTEKSGPLKTSTAIGVWFRNIQMKQDAIFSKS